MSQVTSDGETFFIVGKADDKIVGKWEFIGLFSDDAMALSACRSRNYFIGPAKLNTVLPDESIEWPGLRYPLAEEIP